MCEFVRYPAGRVNRKDRAALIENFGASRQRVYEELRQFLEVVGSGDITDDYAAMMSTLPSRQCREAEALFRDYMHLFTDTKGLRMRVLRLVHEAYAAGLEESAAASS
jgi:hypothetical protein